MIKKFNQFGTSEWIGPVKILDIEGDIIWTNLGIYKNISGNPIKIGYSYLLRIMDVPMTSGMNKIIDTGMSCVDLIVLINSGSNYKFLCIKRGHQPFAGMWAFPGGNIDEGELPIDAAVRELQEETGVVVEKDDLIYTGSFSDPWRDPRNKNCISYAFAIILDKMPDTMAGDDATECTWNDVSYDGKTNVDMAFDHAEILEKSIKNINK